MGEGIVKKLGSHLILDDERAGGIDSEDARDVIDAINEQLGSETIQFYTGDRHRHLMVWIGSNARCICHDPRAVHGHSIEPFLPSGNGADVLIELMEASRILLRHHPLNQEREQAGLKPVNCLWLWGPGKAIELPKWKQQGVITSATISPSGVHRGIAICAGIDVLNLQNSSEEPQTEFSQYLKACQDALQSKDFVYLHVPMPYMDRATALQSSLKSIETFDEQLIGPLMQSISEHEDTRFLVVCNHDDEEARGTNRSPTPYAYLQNTGGPPVGPQPSFHEMNAAKGPSRDAIKFASRMLAT